MRITKNGRLLSLTLVARYGVAVPDDLATRLCRTAQLLHTQSENVCSYVWADTPSYRRRCDLTEARAKRLAQELQQYGLVADIQGDPRGLAIKIGRTESDLDRWASDYVGQVGLH
jgi:hypothetical protein